MKLNNLLALLASLVFSTAALSVSAATNLTPNSGSIFVASTGEVKLTFISKTASFSNDLYLMGRPNSILNNQTALAGTEYSLGSFAAGSVLDFSMFVRDQGFAYYTGGALHNPDGKNHTAFENIAGQALKVGFEDIYNGGDQDYDDLVFSLSNVSLGNALPNVAVVPEPQTYAMFFAGLAMLGLSRRNRTA